MTEAAATTTNTEQLNLKVKSQVSPSHTQDGEEVFFKIKASTQLKKLMDAYCQRQSVNRPQLSSTWPTCASSSTARDSTRTRPPRTSTWRTETRLTSWSSKSEARPSDHLLPQSTYFLPLTIILPKTHQSLLLQVLSWWRALSKIPALDFQVLPIGELLRWSGLLWAVATAMVILQGLALPWEWLVAIGCLLPIIIEGRFPDWVALLIKTAFPFVLHLVLRLLGLIFVLDFHLGLPRDGNLLLEGTRFKGLAQKWFVHLFLLLRA